MPWVKLSSSEKVFNIFEKHVFEKESIQNVQKLDDLSQIELPFLPEKKGHKNLLETDIPGLKENLAHNEIPIAQDFQIDERNKISPPSKLERDEMLFSFSQEFNENSETDDLTRRENTREDKKTNKEQEEVKEEKKDK